jgi:putative Holliday junction resolvase
MQEQEILNADQFAIPPELPARRRVLAFDPGTKRWGAAVSDEEQNIATPLEAFSSTNWKKLLSSIQALIAEFDAAAVVIGLPLESDGSRGYMAKYALGTARKLSLSLAVPVFLQDERISTYEARRRIWSRGETADRGSGKVDSEAAAVILGDFLDRITSAKS